MILHEEYMHFRQKEIFDEADHIRLIKSIEPSTRHQNVIFARAMKGIGKMLLNWGAWLTNRYEDKKIVGDQGMVGKKVEGVQ